MDLSVSLILVSLIKAHLSSVSLKTLFLVGFGSGILILTSRVLLPVILFSLVVLVDGLGLETIQPMAYNKCY